MRDLRGRRCVVREGWLVPDGSFVLDRSQLTGAAIAGATAMFQPAALVEDLYRGTRTKVQ